ncbi:MAG: hypothetical protein ABSG36_06575 [Acidimicrobiales bacterium]|jgi:hypothetical protein
MRFLLQESSEVERPFAAVRERFIGDTSWFAPLATAAEQDGEQLYFRIGPSWASGWAARKVVVTLGQPHQRGTGLVVPLSWRATDLPGLFPVLDGDIELVPLGLDRCRVSLSASYVPPLGELGRRLDRAILHRVAESTARSFLARVSRSLELGDPAAPDSSAAEGDG